MNKIEVTIDMRDDLLQFSSTVTSTTKAHLKAFPSIEKSSSFSKIVKSVNSVSSVSSVTSSSSTSINFASSFDSLNIVIIKTAVYRSLARNSEVIIFAIIVTEVDRLLKTIKNKFDAVNISLHELSREKAMKKVKAKLSL